MSSGVASTAIRKPLRTSSQIAARSPVANSQRGRPASPRRSASTPRAVVLGIDGDRQRRTVELCGIRFSSSFIRAVSRGQEAGQRVKMKSTIAGRPASAARSSAAPLRSMRENSGSSESTGSGSPPPEGRSRAPPRPGQHSEQSVPGEASPQEEVIDDGDAEDRREIEDRGQQQSACRRHRLLAGEEHGARPGRRGRRTAPRRDARRR